MIRGGAGYLGLLALIGTSACSGDHKDTLKPGDIETWAGDGTQGYDGDGHDRLQSWFNTPMEMAFQADGGALVVDWNNHRLRRVRTDGVLENVIGTDMPGDWPCQIPDDPTQCEVPLSGTVPGAELSLNHPMDVALGEGGSFELAAWHNHKIEHFDRSSLEVSIVAGQQKPGAGGDGGPASAAYLFFPSSVVRQEDGGLLVGDEKNNRVRRIAPDAARTISTVAGVPAGTTGSADDGIPAEQAALALAPSDAAAGAANPLPGGALALAPDGSVYVADTFHHCVRRVDPGPNGIVDGVDASEEKITTVAGTCGTSGYAGDGGPATSALLNHPFDLEFDSDGSLLFIADTANNVVRCVELETGTIRTVAGTGQPGFSGDRGPAVDAKLRSPYGLAFDPEGSLYIVDTMNNRIRRVVGQ